MLTICLRTKYNLPILHILFCFVVYLTKLFSMEGAKVHLCLGRRGTEFYCTKIRLSADRPRMLVYLFILFQLKII
jgi:hypothetical protein